MPATPKNAYPALPELPYEHTTVTMLDVIAYLHVLTVPTEVKRAAYILFRNESANGSKGINNNYAGVQADGGPWPAQWDAAIVGTVVLTENGTGKKRRFVAFRHWQDSVDFLVDRVQSRGLYVGGTTHLVVQMHVANDHYLARAYTKEWVTGSAGAEPNAQALGSFLSMYGQAAALFRHVLGEPAPVISVPAAELTADDLNARFQAGEPFPLKDAK